MRNGRCAYSRDGSVAAYLDGALPADRLRDFEEHLGRCAACRDDLRATLWLLHQLSRLDGSGMPRARKESLLRTLRRDVTRAASAGGAREASSP